MVVTTLMITKRDITDLLNCDAMLIVERLEYPCYLGYTYLDKVPTLCDGRQKSRSWHLVNAKTVRQRHTPT